MGHELSGTNNAAFDVMGNADSDARRDDTFPGTNAGSGHTYSGPRDDAISDACGDRDAIADAYGDGDAIASHDARAYTDARDDVFSHAHVHPGPSGLRPRWVHGHGGRLR